MNISCIPYKHKYFNDLIDLLKDRNYPGIDYINKQTLPKIGYISIISNQVIAAGFLRRVEGGFAQLDTFVSNPYFGSQIRHEGIKLVVDRLLEDAKSLKLQGIIAFTEDDGILSRAKSLGFNEINQKLIGLNLKAKVSR